MSFDAIRPGLIGESQLVVSAEHTAQHLGSGAVRVLATPQMVLLMEQAGVAAVDHLLPEGYRTVGAHLDVRHLAPTPVGFEVKASAELLEIEGRKLTFRVEVHEQLPESRTLVGEGTHQRAIISIRRFGDLVAEKMAQLPQ